VTDEVDVMSKPNGTVSPSSPGTPLAEPTPTGPIDVPPAAAEGPAADDPGATTTAPVTVRPTVRGRRRGPLTRMGPWAPVAGAGLGTLFGVVVVLLLGGSADDFRERLALVLVVVGLGLLGAAGTLLADEVRIVRRGAREAVVRPAWVEATAGLVNGLTPARLLLLVSAFVLFLATYVAKG
jgi:hypothetical protein